MPASAALPANTDGTWEKSAFFREKSAFSASIWDRIWSSEIFSAEVFQMTCTTTGMTISPAGASEAVPLTMVPVPKEAVPVMQRSWAPDTKGMISIDRMQKRSLMVYLLGKYEVFQQESGSLVFRSDRWDRACACHQVTASSLLNERPIFIFDKLAGSVDGWIVAGWPGISGIPSGFFVLSGHETFRPVLLALAAAHRLRRRCR